MKENRFFTVTALIILTSSLSAQGFKLPELSGFKKETNYPVFKPEKLWDFINGAADTYLAYGFVDLHVAEYKKGKNVIKLEVYRHSNNTLAFGIYSTERSPSFRYMTLGAQGYRADGAINFFKGNYYVKIRTYSVKEKTLQAEEQLARKVESMLQGETTMPSLLALFPAEGKKTNEETYVNESVLGHQFLNKGFKAIYHTGNDDFNIFLLKYATADETMKAAREYLAIGNIEPALRRSMNKMCCRPKALPEVVAGACQLKYAGRSNISIFSDQLVDSLVFAEFCQAGCQDDQLAVIGKRHARPVNAFVSKPGAFKFRRIKINNRLPDRGFQ